MADPTTNTKNLAPVLRVVGPPGAGKSLFITSMQEALRQHDVRSASVVSAGPGITTIVVSNGGRSTLERDLPLSYIPQVISWVDPSVRVILAEAYDEPGAPAVEVRPTGALPHPIPEAERFAVVDADDLAQHFAQDGPGYTAGVAERVVGEWLHQKPRPIPNVAREMQKRTAALGSPPPTEARGAVRRLLDRLRR